MVITNNILKFQAILYRIKACQTILLTSIFRGLFCQDLVHFLALRNFQKTSWRQTFRNRRQMRAFPDLCCLKKEVFQFSLISDRCQHLSKCHVKICQNVTSKSIKMSCQIVRIDICRVYNRFLQQWLPQTLGRRYVGVCVARAYSQPSRVECSA